MKQEIKIFLPLFIIIPVSLQAFLGLNFGYFLSNFYLKKITRMNRKFPTSIFFPIGKKYCFKVHHWLYPLFFLTLIFVLPVKTLQTPFLLGSLGGIAYHDFVNDPQWWKILIKKT